MERIPIIIDTDPGVDDSFCLAFAVAHRDIIDLKGVTTIGGNNTTEVTTRNALALLHLYHADDVPVAAGHNSYFKAPFGKPAVKFHGENGLADQIIPDSPNRPVDMAACDFIHKTAVECAGKLVLVTVGPETNLALAFQKYSDLSALVSKVVVMGGSLSVGNVTPFAEANIWNDVPAADIVFRSGVPIDMVGLNVTLKCEVPQSLLEEAQGTREDVRSFMSALIKFRNGNPLHDSVAIATMFDSGLVKWKTGTIEVSTAQDESYGRTVFHAGGPNSPMRAASEVDYDCYERLFVQTAEYFSEQQ